MSIEKQRIEGFEKKYKDVVFELLEGTRKKQFKCINISYKNAEKIDQGDISLPNVGITMNNKIVELSNIFKEAGISMFVLPLEKYDMVVSSYLGDAIIHDLNDRVVESMHKLEEYNNAIKDIMEDKYAKLMQLEALENVGPIKRFFSRIKSLFKPVEPIDLSITDEEQERLDNLLEEYNDIDSKIWNYTLEKDLKQSLVKEITAPKQIGGYEMKHGHDASNVPELLEESIVPDLKKLGLEHIIPDLQKEIVEEYKKDSPDSEDFKGSLAYMSSYVPDFSKKSSSSQSALDEENER